MKKIVPFLVGPTGIGKTKVSVLIAKTLPVEIVSADSRQIYRLLDIGTAKPSREVLKSIPHHFINFLRPDEYFSAGMYSQIARRVVSQIIKRDKVPLVVGGSGLYIKALIDGLHDLDVRDEKIRHSLRQRMMKEGIDKLYNELKRIDEKLAQKIAKNDRQRILRGLEVYLKTGKKLSSLHESRTNPADFDSLIFGLTAKREYLYNNINDRVDKMIEEGFLSEVANLKLKGYSFNLNSLNTVGYTEVFDYFNDKISFEDMIQLIKKNSRRYAKRQLTWFNKDKRIKWIHMDEDTGLEKVVQSIIQDYNKKASAN
jgi:tRNA dimethylallyltransferase